MNWLNSLICKLLGHKRGVKFSSRVDDKGRTVSYYRCARCKRVTERKSKLPGTPVPTA